MTWIKLPIQDQWQNALDVNAAGFVFKTYLVGTTTPTPMAIDQNGATTVSTVTLNADGIPEVSGNEVTLYIDRDFRFAIYENSSDAAANTNAFYGPVDVYNHIRDDDIIVVDDFTGLTGKLTDSGIAIGSLIKTLSPDGFTYKKLQGVATDDGIRIITENRGTTVAAQYYGELTAEADDLPDYSTDGDFYSDTGASGTAYVLNLQTGRVPLKTLRNGARFRFEAANTGTGGATTADISDALGQAAGTTIKSVKLATGADPSAGHIDGHAALIYDLSGDILILDRIYRPLATDEVGTTNIAAGSVTLAKMAAGSVDTAQIVAAAIGTAEIATSTSSVAGSISASTGIDITLNAYSFFPMIHTSTESVRVTGHGTDGASPDAPRFRLYETGSGATYDVDCRHMVAA